MEKIIDGVMMSLVFTLVIASGGCFTLQKAYYWSRNAALEKAAKGLGSLERSSRIMTGGKLDY